MRRLALDLGKHLGWCDNDDKWTSGFVELLEKGKTEESIYHAFYVLLLDLRDYNAYDQIVYEMPYTMNRNNDAVILYGLLGVLKLFAYEKDIQLMAVNPGTLKKEITGYGKADKADMIFMAEQYIDKPIESSDEADAVCLMAYAEFGEAK
jgi:Holliday junction resolvasome RuvABC endonuclease subunit